MYSKNRLQPKSESKSQRIDAALEFMQAGVEARKVQKAIDRTARLLGQQTTKEFKDEYLKPTIACPSENIFFFPLPVKLLGEIRRDRRADTSTIDRVV